jgi:UDP-N-acetylmuramyl pentapeptide synthase
MTNRRTTLGAIEARLAREELLAGDGRLSDGHAAREVWDVTADSRQVRVGAVFCAWKGTRSDAHQYLPAVFEAGAAGRWWRRARRTSPPRSSA